MREINHNSINKYSKTVKEQERNTANDGVRVDIYCLDGRSETVEFDKDNNILFHTYFIMGKPFEGL